jgi:YfiR/HmsC-like
MSREVFDSGRSAIRRRVWGGIQALAGLLVCWLGTIPPVTAQATTPEATVKAAFVFNFLRFTEWPARRFAAKNAPLSLCVWSTDARLSESLRTLAGRTVDERRVDVSDIERADELGKCHALFVADVSARSSASGWRRKAESLDVLTMGDGDGFAASGGMIGLVSDGTRMRFEINDRAVKRSGLKLGPQLYQVGRSVAEGAPR